MTKTEKLLKLIKENPDLPVVPMVDGEVVADDSNQYWLGFWGTSEVTEYYKGREYVHFKSDDEEDVMLDLAGCDWCCAPDGRDVYDLSDEEWDKVYAELPWVKCIVVYITT